MPPMTANECAPPILKIGKAETKGLPFHLDDWGFGWHSELTLAASVAQW